jgi:gamma-glutamyl hercynylcysteine S-oxide synthase
LSALSADLAASRAHTVRVTAGLDGARLFGPKLAIVNPPLWEIGHVGWFQERWCLRARDDGSLGGSLLADADRLYDSSAVAHDTRWDLPLPSLQDTHGYLANVLERVLHRIEKEPENPRLAYFVRLATLHEDMHAEAFHYTHQTLGYPEPEFGVRVAIDEEKNYDPDPELAFAGGTLRMGAERGTKEFVFDNEKWAHEVEVAPFCISARAVTNRQYLAHIDETATPLRRHSARTWLGVRSPKARGLTPTCLSPTDATASSSSGSGSSSCGRQPRCTDHFLDLGVASYTSAAAATFNRELTQR